MKIIGMPVNMYSLLIAFLIRNFWKALIIDMSWKIIGTILIFIIGRHFLKDLVNSYFAENKTFLTLVILV